jgi:hypothetical protein
MDLGILTIGAYMIDPSHPAPIWVIWPYLSWLERVSFLAICGLGIYSLFLVSAVVRLRGIASNPKDPTSSQEGLLRVRGRLTKLKQSTVAVFYFFGFVLFAGFLSAYSVVALTKVPIGLIVVQNLQSHFAFAGNMFFFFLVIHFVQWFVARRADAFALRFNS